MNLFQGSLRASFFFFALTSFITLNVKSQTHIYEAFIRGNKVGEMKVVQEVNDESEKISVVTHIEAHMLVTIRVDFESHSTYMDGNLVESTAISKTNGRVHSQTETSLKNGRYVVTEGRKSKTLEETTLYGGDLFYCEEPTDIRQVYALASGEFLKVEKAPNGGYYFEHDGKKELHTYQDGVLQELQIDHKLYTVIFKLKP